MLVACTKYMMYPQTRMLSAALEICVPLLVRHSNRICGTSCTTDSAPPAQPHQDMECAQGECSKSLLIVTQN